MKSFLRCTICLQHRLLATSAINISNERQDKPMKQIDTARSTSASGYAGVFEVFFTGVFTVLNIVASRYEQLLDVGQQL